MLEGAAADPDALLRLLGALLGGIGGAGAPTLLGSPQAFAALRSLTLLAGARYVEAAGGAKSHSTTMYACMVPGGCSRQEASSDALGKSSLTTPRILHSSATRNPDG